MARVKDNTIKASNNVDIYEHDIALYCDEYISTLNRPEDISKKQCFAGMIKYISMKIKPDLDYNNLVQLNDLWNIYTGLCYKYNHTVSIERYCILINISKDTFYCWLNNAYKDKNNNITEYNNTYRTTYCEELSISRSDLMKKWDAESESSWQDEASTGNPGAMFVLKARRGWQETAPAQNPQQIQGPSRTAAQIASDYGVTLEDKNAPITPDF